MDKRIIVVDSQKLSMIQTFVAMTVWYLFCVYVGYLMAVSLATVRAK